MGGGSTGLRTSKQALRQAQGDRAEVSTFLWDGQTLLLEADGGGTTQAQYTAAPGGYGPTVAQRRGTVSSLYHPTDLGTIENLTDASGNVTDSYAFTAFGVPVATTGSTTNPHRYIGALGYYTDPTTGLDYVRARHLRPATGSWLSVDPVPSEPRYQYVGGRASRASDASGMWPLEDYWKCARALVKCKATTLLAVVTCAACIIAPEPVTKVWVCWTLCGGAAAVAWAECLEWWVDCLGRAAWELGSLIHISLAPAPPPPGPTDGRPSPPPRPPTTDERMSAPDERMSAPDERMSPPSPRR